MVPPAARPGERGGSRRAGTAENRRPPASAAAAAAAPWHRGPGRAVSPPRRHCGTPATAAQAARCACRSVAHHLVAALGQHVPGALGHDLANLHQLVVAVVGKVEVVLEAADEARVDLGEHLAHLLRVAGQDDRQLRAPGSQPGQQLLHALLREGVAVPRHQAVSLVDEEHPAERLAQYWPAASSAWCRRRARRSGRRRSPPSPCCRSIIPGPQRCGPGSRPRGSRPCPRRRTPCAATAPGPGSRWRALHGLPGRLPPHLLLDRRQPDQRVQVLLGVCGLAGASVRKASERDTGQPLPCKKRPVPTGRQCHVGHLGPAQWESSAGHSSAVPAGLRGRGRGAHASASDADFASTTRSTAACLGQPGQGRKRFHRSALCLSRRAHAAVGQGAELARPRAGARPRRAAPTSATERRAGVGESARPRSDRTAARRAGGPAPSARPSPAARVEQHPLRRPRRRPLAEEAVVVGLIVVGRRGGRRRGRRAGRACSQPAAMRPTTRRSPGRTGGASTDAAEDGDALVGGRRGEGENGLEQRLRRRAVQPGVERGGQGSEAVPHAFL